MAAAEKLKTGKIITFDDTQGSRRMGILLNKGVDAKELVSELDVKFPAADDAFRFFERTGGNGMVKTSDKLLRISRMSRMETRAVSPYPQPRPRAGNTI